MNGRSIPEKGHEWPPGPAGEQWRRAPLTGVHALCTTLPRPFKAEKSVLSCHDAITVTSVSRGTTTISIQANSS